MKKNKKKMRKKVKSLKNEVRDLKLELARQETTHRSIREAITTTEEKVRKDVLIESYDDLINIELHIAAFIYQNSSSFFLTNKNDLQQLYHGPHSDYAIDLDCEFEIKEDLEGVEPLRTEVQNLIDLLKERSARINDIRPRDRLTMKRNYSNNQKAMMEWPDLFKRYKYALNIEAQMFRLLQLVEVPNEEKIKEKNQKVRRPEC